MILHLQIVWYILTTITRSINSVTTIVHEITVKNGLLIDIRYCITYYKVSKPFFIVTQSCWQCLRKVFVLKEQFASPCPYPQTSNPCPCSRTTSPCPRALSPWQQHWSLLYFMAGLIKIMIFFNKNQKIVDLNRIFFNLNPIFFTVIVTAYLPCCWYSATCLTVTNIRLLLLL